MAGPRTIAFPESVLLTARTLDDLEDWLAAHDAEFLARMRQIRNGEDLAGEGKDLDEILKQWPTGS